MTSDLVFLAAAASQALALVSVFVITLRERAALGAFVGAVARWSRKQGDGPPEPEVIRLPPQYHGAATRLTEGLNGGGDLDEAVTRAIAATADGALRPAPPAPIAIDVILAVLALGPAIQALVRAAERLAVSWRLPAETDASRLYALRLTEVPAAFADVQAGFGASALLVASLCAVWAVRWCFLRAEAREARALRAVLEAAIAARPGEPAPAGALLAKLLAPSTSLAPAIRASIAFGVMLAGAWLALTAATPLRRENAGPPRFSAWPERRIAAVASVREALPAAAAGQPIRDAAGASLVFDRAGVQLAQERIAELEEGNLPDGWQAEMTRVQDVLRPFHSPDGHLNLIVLGHRDVPARTVTSVIGQIDRQQSAARYQLVVERAIPRGSGAEPRAAQASLSLQVDAAGVPASSPVRLRVEREVVRVDGRSISPIEVPFDDAGWERIIRDTVRRETGLGTAGGSGSARVTVAAASGVSYERFVQVIAAADSACEGDGDCGLPGLGLELVLTP